VKVFMTGGTGFVGKALARALVSGGHSVSVLSRRAGPGEGAPGGITYVQGDPAAGGEWQDAAAAHDAIVNLAGRSIFTRWTPDVKRDIRESRILITSNVVDAIARSGGICRLLINASAVGYYGFHGDETLDETDGAGRDFLAGVARDWEAAASGAREHGARVVLCRFGIVLGRGGGALGQMLKTYRRLPVSPLGSGKQWFSWIHQADLSEAMKFLLESDGTDGPANCTAPGPVTNRDFTLALARALGRRMLPVGVPSFALSIVLGEFGKMLLEGQRVMPRRLLDAGFRFSYPDIEAALADLLDGR
jgi:uncharacterized protein (TIGR01777 family)